MGEMIAIAIKSIAVIAGVIAIMAFCRVSWEILTDRSQ